MIAIMSNIWIRPPPIPPMSPTSQRITITTIMATNRSINDSPHVISTGYISYILA
jgi:hypothetical protein